MRAAIYVRISKDQTGEAAGVTRQEEDCRALAARLGATVTAVYSDNDISAYTGAPRPGYRALLDRIAAGGVDVVLVWHVDRLYRRMPELEEYITVSQGAPTHAVHSGMLDLSTPSGRMVARQLGAVAQYESEQKAERQRRANRQRAEQGRHFGTRRPIGFEVDGVTVREVEAQAIRGAFGWVLDGVPLREIARRWNALGLRTPQAGNEWTGDVVSLVLRRPRLAGMRQYRGQIMTDASGAPVPTEWPALVDRETWQAVQARLTDPARRRPPASQQLLSGVAVCDECGATIQSGGRRNGVRRYRCRAMGGHVYRSAPPVDEVVELAMIERLSRPDAADLLAPPAADTAAVRAELAELAQRSDALAEAYAEGVVSLSQLKAANERAAGRRAALEARLPVPVSPALAALVGAVDVGAEWRGMGVDARRMVIDSLATVRLVPPGTKEHAYLDWRRGIANPDTVLVLWRGSPRLAPQRAGRRTT